MIFFPEVIFRIPVAFVSVKIRLQLIPGGNIHAMDASVLFGSGGFSSNSYIFRFLVGIHDAEPARLLKGYVKHAMVQGGFLFDVIYPASSVSSSCRCGRRTGSGT
jgi:hypothetical protein